jgi:hypothetical protein
MKRAVPQLISTACFALLLCTVAPRSLSAAREAGIAEDSSRSSIQELIATRSLGSFRVIAVNLLWARAVGAWTRGEWHEAALTYESITRLQPRQEQVWLYAAMTLSLDMAHALREAERPEDASRAVVRGLRLLKRGVDRNPKSALLWHGFGMLAFHCGRDPRNYRAVVHDLGEPLEIASAGLARACSLEPEDYRNDYHLYIVSTARAQQLGARGDPQRALQQVAQARASLARAKASLQHMTEHNAELVDGLPSRFAGLDALEAQLTNDAGASSSSEGERP